MAAQKSYKTKQQSAILACIEAHSGSYVTVSEIADALRESKSDIGLTTIYRNLEKLVEQGTVVKIRVEGEPGACYQYLAPDNDSSDIFYLKCENCGTMLGSDCSHLKELYAHLAADHHFTINPGKTVFYGQCDKCKGDKHEQ